MFLERFTKRLAVRKTGAQHNESFRLDQAVNIFLADDCGLKYSFMRDEGALDVERRDPDSRHLKHVIGAPAVKVIPAIADTVFVACVRPLAAKRAPGFFPLQPVALSGAWPANDKLADFPGSDRSAIIVQQLCVIAGHRRARGAVANLARPVGDKNVQHLGRADAVNDFNADLLLPAFANFFR